ncbi:MAG: hypothetical protein LBJ00_01015 [Planctomycetaceae bacterium]|jgi:hypothetical protein|nr:hypothetical protein [Planctomycetaceae bacterium]
MTAQELAEKLNGIEYNRGIPEEYYPVLVESGLAVVLGGSDDLCYFLYPENGKVATEELPCWEGETFWFDRDFKKFLDGKHRTMLTYHDNVKANCRNSIAAVWCDETVKAPDGDYYSWTYKTNIPHATFDIVEHDGESVLHYCKAIIFSINDLKE